MVALLDRELLVVTGKGGTGKTTVAAGLARLAAQANKRVLLCDVDATGDLGKPFGISGYGYDPTEVEPGLFLMQMDTEASLREYLELNLKLPFVAKVGSLARAFDFIATAAPGVREILVMGKLAWEVKRENYDIVIVDASATGHIVAQLGSADSIGDLVSSGPLTAQTAWMKDMLGNPDRTGVVIVTTPEELPVNETIDLSHRLEQKTRVHLAGVIVNRVLPQVFTRSDAQVFADIETNGGDVLDRHVGAGADGVVRALHLASALRRTQVTHLEELQRAITEVPIMFVPQSFGPSDAVSVSTEVFAALSDELS